MNSAQALNSFRPLPATQSLSAGQIVIVSARWLFVLTGLVLLLLEPGPDLWAFRFRILILLLLGVLNFHLFIQAILRRPTLQIVIYLASLADLAVITLSGLWQHGFQSRLFVFYFPALLAISVAFPPLILTIFSIALLIAYGMIGLATVGVPFYEVAALLIRLIMLAAIVFIGNRFAQLERRPKQPTPEGRTERLGIKEIVTLPDSAALTATPTGANHAS